MAHYLVAGGVGT